MAGVAVHRHIADARCLARPGGQLRNADLDDAVLDAGADCGDVGIRGQREGAVETSKATFNAMHFVCFLLVLMLTLARNAEYITVHHLDLDIGRRQARRIGPHHMSVLGSVT